MERQESTFEVQPQTVSRYQHKFIKYKSGVTTLTLIRYHNLKNLSDKCHFKMKLQEN